jgi:hypothetical protein
MDAKAYHALPHGTRVVKRFNGKVVHGQVVKAWDRTSRSSYTYSRFLADGQQRSTTTHPCYIELE